MPKNDAFSLLRRNSSQLLRRTGGFLTRLSGQIYERPEQKRDISWFRDRGDKTLRLNYELSEESMVFDLGGFEGQWTSDISGMYAPFVHVFEPVPKFAGRIRERFSKNRKIAVHEFGLADETKRVKISLDGDASSVFTSGDVSADAHMVRASEFFVDYEISHIDLMKINIEGGEYDLLEHMIGAGLVHRIQNIQVQFHDFVPGAKERMAAIQTGLQSTHFLTYQYPFVWENWRRNSESHSRNEDT